MQLINSDTPQVTNGVSSNVDLASYMDTRKSCSPSQRQAIVGALPNDGSVVEERNVLQSRALHSTNTSPMESPDSQMLQGHLSALYMEPGEFQDDFGLTSTDDGTFLGGLMPSSTLLPPTDRETMLQYTSTCRLETDIHQLQVGTRCAPASEPSLLPATQLRGMAGPKTYSFALPDALIEHL